LPTSQSDLGSLGNVERLGFRPIDRRPVDPPPPDFQALFLGLQNVFEVQNQKTMAIVQQVSSETVKNVMGSANLSMVGTFQAIGMILAVRVILLLSVCGAFSLAIIAMQSQTNQAIGILVSFVALTVLPLVWLDRNGRRKTTEQ